MLSYLHVMYAYSQPCDRVKASQNQVMQAELLHASHAKVESCMKGRHWGGQSQIVSVGFAWGC